MLLSWRRSSWFSFSFLFWIVFSFSIEVSFTFLPEISNPETTCFVSHFITHPFSSDHRYASIAGARMSSTENGGEESSDMRFGKFRIPSSHIFFRSRLSAAFVNIRPIVPGHVLVVPKRIAPLLADLTQDEYQDLWQSVRTVQNALTKHYDATAFNVAVQDGYHAGQSVPHVHIHLLPRAEGDFERNDDIYDELQEWAPRKEMQVSKPKLDVPDDQDRKDRTPREMSAEAASYRNLLSQT